MIFFFHLKYLFSLCTASYATPAEAKQMSSRFAFGKTQLLEENIILVSNMAN